MKNLFFLFILLTTQSIFAQKFEGILLNKNDSTTLSFATIKLLQTGKYTLANEKGEFQFELPPNSQIIELEISHVSCHTTIRHSISNQKPNLIYLSCSGIALEDVVIGDINQNGDLEEQFLGK